MGREFEGFGITDDQVAYIRFFARRFDSGERHINYQAFCEQFNIQGDGQEQFWNAILPIEHLQVFEQSSSGSINVLPKSVLAVKYFDAPPPPRDYLDEWTKWARGSKWVSGAFVFAFVIPLVWSWCQMVSGLFEWIVNGKTPTP